MNKYFSLTSPLLLLITVIAIVLSGNDKSLFLIMFPLIYSFTLSLVYSFILIKSYVKPLDVNKKHICIQLFLSLIPIIAIAVVIILSRLGVITGI
jgi:hypothetical protein